MTDQQLVAVPRDVLEALLDGKKFFSRRVNGIFAGSVDVKHAIHQALANPGVTVEGEVWRPNAESTGFITEGTTVPVGFPEGTCLVTVTSIKGVSDE